MNARRHDIDALRVFAFALLILYHTTMVYVADWGYHIKSEHTAEWLQWPMIFMNRWRMSLLFLISGIAIALAAPEGRPWRFASTRTWRLMLPLVFGMFVVVPIQPYCEGVTNGHVAPGFFRFLASYWHVHRWPRDSFTGAEHGITWNHLWYLPYLWAYTLVLVALMPVLAGSWAKRVVAWFSRCNAVILLGVPSLVILFYNLYLLPRFPATDAFFGDWYQHAKYGTVFLAGYLLGRSDTFWVRVLVDRKRNTGMALASIALYFLPGIAGPLLPSDAWAFRLPGMFWHMLTESAQALYLWTALLAILGWGKALLDRPFRWLPYCTEAVYPWYMLHQSLIIALVFWLQPLDLGPWAEPLLVIGGTIIGCYTLHEFMIRRVTWLRPFFGLKPKPLPSHGA